MPRFKVPRCIAPDEMDGRPEKSCNVEMKMVGERHPLWKPGQWVFMCPRCESVRVIDDLKAERYCERV